MPILTDRGRAVPARPSTAPATTPPMDPRIHDRLLAVQREATRRRHRWMIAVATVVVMAAAAIGVTRSSLLAVHHVRLSGEHHTTTAEVLAVTRLDRKPLMVQLGTGRLRAALETLPWVATATVGRHWPTTVDIHLTERTPVAIVVGAAGAAALLDGTGRVLALGAGAAPNVPTITGVTPAGPPGSVLPRAPGVSDALVLAAALPPVEAASPSQIKQIVVAHGTLDLTLSGGAVVTFGTADQLDAKLLALHTVLQRVDLKGIAGIDLRIPNAPVLTHATQGGTVSTIPRG